MIPFTKPLIALSLTDPDEGMLHYAAMLTGLFQWRDVHFVHIAPPDRSAESGDLRSCEERLREEVKRVYGRPIANAQVMCHTAQGSRLDELLRLTVEHERDLVVLGHRRMRSGRRSLARRLAMVCPSSVWLAPEGSPAAIRNILVPTDFSEESADSLAAAVKIARAAGLEQCRAVHVFFDPSTVRFDEHLEEILGKEEAAFENLLATIDTEGVEVEPVFHESSHTAEGILRMADRYQSDLIVMGTRGRSQAASVLLGSTTSDTMACTTVPLLAIKHCGGRMNLLQALLNHRVWERTSPKSN